MSSSPIDPWTAVATTPGSRDSPLKAAKTEEERPPFEVTFQTRFDSNAVEWEGRCVRENLAADCELPGGLGHVVAGTGLRNLGRGVMSVRGVPPGARLVEAILYLATIEPEDDPIHASNVQFRDVHDNQPIDKLGDLIGECLQPCWIEPPETSGGSTQPSIGISPGGTPGFMFSVSYWEGMNLRAYSFDVTADILDGINGDYEISGVPSVIEDGSDPTSETSGRLFPGNVSAEGAALVVIYAHEDLPRGTRTYVYEGPEFLFQHLTVHHGLSEPIETGSVLYHSRIGAGGQVRYMGEPIHPYSTYLMGAAAESFVSNGDRNFPSSQEGRYEIRGWTSPVNKRTDWSGARGEGLQRLWDAEQDYFDVPPGLELREGFRIRYAVDMEFVDRHEPLALDCVGVVAHVLTVRAP